MGAIVYGPADHAWDYINKNFNIDKKRCFILEREDMSKDYKVSDLTPLGTYVSDDTNFQKACIIPEAERLSETVQNKLLKVIEDSDTDFYLLASSADNLLPTIKSRLCQFYVEKDDTGFPYFSSLATRIELFEKYPVTKKEFVQPMPVYSFIRKTEDTFLKAYLQPDLISRLWNEKEIERVCSVCEDFLKKSYLTKDDLFAFFVIITGIQC